MKKLLRSVILLAAFAVSSASYAGPFVVGDVFASIGNGQVNVYSNTGVFKATLDTGLGGFTTGSAFDANGNFYVTAFSNNTVSQFDPNGVLLNASWATGLGANESIVFNKAGDAYIGNAGAAQILKVDANGAPLDTFNVASHTDWIDLAADQTTMVYSDESSTLRQWDVGPTPPCPTSRPSAARTMPSASGRTAICWWPTATATSIASIQPACCSRPIRSASARSSR